MRPEQKIVAIGAASGVIGMVLTVWLLTTWLPAPVGIDTTADRLAFALRINLIAVLPLFGMIITIANSRFLSEAIDPTRKAENQRQIVDGRVADNTLQQNFVFVIVSLTLATLIPVTHLQVVWACAVVFVIARLVFWIGYRIHPLYRAPGMSGTAYLNLGMILYVLYSMVTRS
jgi:hypothetical protein